METTVYGIGVQNRFDLYRDDDVEDPFEILRQQEAELQKLKLSKGKSKNAGVKQPRNVGNKQKNEPPVPKASGGLSQKASKVEKTFSSGPTNDRNRNVEITTVPEGRWKDEPRRARGGFVGARGGARNTGDGFNQRGKREFDRQSGSNKSGVKPVEKREGGGAHNWGNVKEDMQFEDNPESEERNIEEVQPTADTVSSELSSCADTKTDELTLDEWKQKEQRRRFVPNYNIRKPGEGEKDNKKWGKVYMLKKKEMEEEFEDEEYEEDEISKRGRQKHLLDIEITFEDTSLRGRGRGRGFGRGGRGKSFANSEETNVAIPKPAPKVDDLNDFPSLSAT